MGIIIIINSNKHIYSNLSESLNMQNLCWVCVYYYFVM